ncbi:apolipoprotein N-acyltransferase [Actinomycetaceae bacterium WB03_NA08]|uniref:Apolipoprotein N-acyltransferase n=1 Tax=Scrofimicrobium canadense TaxID=2652290 RepID=A0A6N7W3A7_9ACTO|nr:apolipoprotein N-acyltransferase [Scrofimicrobium canadense]MSS83901.1 apolipoprotein N-acyltransferase [Scrofimicrobium canadense]
MERVTVRERLIGYSQLAFSALFMWASFPDVGLWFLVFPSLALLVAATDNVTVGRGAWYGFLWGIGFFLPHISWLLVAVPGSVAPWIALSVAQAASLTLWGTFFAASRHCAWCRTWWGEAFIASLLWVGIEQLRSRVPFGGFSWGKVAYAQVDSPLLTLAPLGGETLVSFAVMFLAVILRYALSLKHKPSPILRWALAGGFTAALIAPMLISLPNTQQSGAVTVAAVQGNVDIPQEETYSVEGKVSANHLRETEKMIIDHPNVDLVIWGENALDRDPAASRITDEIVAQASEAVNVPLLAGFQEYVDDIRYNWMGIWYPETGLDQHKYGKQHPVPWGEYVPYRQLSEWLASEAAQISVDMVPVDNPGILNVRLNDGRDLPIAIGICFEAADEPIFSEGVVLGGEIIVIPTNNAQFVDSTESTQQLQMAQFRAAEFSRAAMQVSTNGVSALIRPDGSILTSTQRQVAGNLVDTLPLRTTITPAAVVAEPLARTAIAATLLLGSIFIGVGIVKKMRK